MNELLPIKITNDRITVSARELYKFLEATERFNNWFERMTQYGLEEGIDFVGCKVFNTLAKQDLQDYQLTIEYAGRKFTLNSKDFHDSFKRVPRRVT